MDYSNPSCCLTSKASRTLPYKIPNARKQLNCSINTQRFRIVGDDNVSDGVKHEMNVGRVHATRFITIDFFIRRFVLSFKLGLNVGRRFFVLLCPCDEFVWDTTFCTIYKRLKGLLPVYSGKQIVRGDFIIFSLKISFLFNRRTIMEKLLVILQHLPKHSKSSCIAFCR